MLIEGRGDLNMGLSARSRCPECDTEAQVALDDTQEPTDSIVKATSEEVIIETACQNGSCSRVWRAVYTFAGNQ